MAMGVSLIFSFVPSAFATIGAGSEFEPTQPNAYASYNNSTNQVQVNWNFDTLPVDTKCLLKGDVRYDEDLNDPLTAEDASISFIPIFYSAVLSSPVILEDNTLLAEEVPCTGEMRIDIDTIMNHSENVNAYTDLQIFLTFYVDDNGDFNAGAIYRIDEVFVMFSAINIWGDGPGEAQEYGCGGQIGSTLYIDASGSGGTLIAHGNNGDNCDQYVYIENDEWVDISMEPEPGNITSNFHPSESFPLLIEVGSESSQTASKSKGGCGGDCTPPTFYKNKNGIKVVSNGFEFNGNATDVINYHTPFDLITVNTNQTYNLKLKVYENNSLEWIQIGWGIPQIGSPLNDAESLTTVYLNFDKTIDSVDTVEKHTLVDITRANVTMGECGYATSECYILDIDFVYRDQQKNNVIVIEAADLARNSVMHYINDGIIIVGESMNDPLTQKVAVSQGGVFYPQKYGTVIITLVDYKNNLWQDEYGYIWSTNQYGPFLVDTIPPSLKEADRMSQSMTRTNSNFADVVVLEQEKALMIFNATKLMN